MFQNQLLPRTEVARQNYIKSRTSEAERIQAKLFQIDHDAKDVVSKIERLQHYLLTLENRKKEFLSLQSSLAEECKVIDQIKENIPKSVMTDWEKYRSTLIQAGLSEKEIEFQKVLWKGAIAKEK